MRTRIGLLAQPKSMHSIIGATQNWLFEPKVGLWLNSYHTCHIYHILCPDMTHMIGMTGVPQAKGLRVPIFLVG